MTDRTIANDRIADWIKALGADFTVVAPMDRGDSPAEFVELAPGDEPVLSGDKMMTTPKDYLLPRYEKLLKAVTKKGVEKVETIMPESKPRVMMGMWLPDAQAIQILDRVFLDDKFKDPYYAARRENTVLVATIPAEPRWSWFCTSVDDVEEWKKSVDALMYDLGDSYYFEPITEAGQALAGGDFFTDATDETTAAKNDVWNGFKNMPKFAFADQKLYEKLAWDDPIWDEIAQKCIGCGMCSYICPSCQCFDIQDEAHEYCVERYRCRDTCQFEDFTLMGAGHNPRGQQMPRSRQRLLHKFKYQHEQFGMVGCTGCGRCVEMCPVNIDVRDIMSRVCGEKQEQEAKP